MDNKITGVIGMVMLVVFLGNYMIKIGSLPLGVVIVAVLALAICDYVLSIREDREPKA